MCAIPPPPPPSRLPFLPSVEEEEEEGNLATIFTWPARVGVLRIVLQPEREREREG